MESKYINRYNTFCKSLKNLEKSRTADPKADFPLGSPRGTLQQTFQNGIIDDDGWMRMLKDRNQLAHDYDGTLATKKFQVIIGEYYKLFFKLKDSVEKFYRNTN